MPDETIWPLDQHTRAKHELLRRYLGAWFPILTYAGYHGRVMFLDGFAGPGIYSNGEPGSPIIALNTLVNHRVFGNWEGPSSCSCSSNPTRQGVRACGPRSSASGNGKAASRET